MYLSVKSITTLSTESPEKVGQIVDQILGQSIVRRGVIHFNFSAPRLP